MSPITDAKPKQFALTMSQEEFQMLKDLAVEAKASAADTCRGLVRAAYAKKFKAKRPGAEIMPTIRAILEDIAGPVHYTGGNIATRSGLPLSLLQDVMTDLEKKRIVECVDHMKPLANQREAGEGQNWTWELRIPRSKLDAALEKAGYDPDEELNKLSRVQRDMLGLFSADMERSWTVEDLTDAMIRIHLAWKDTQSQIVGLLKELMQDGYVRAQSGSSMGLVKTTYVLTKKGREAAMT